MSDKAHDLTMLYLSQTVDCKKINSLALAGLYVRTYNEIAQAIKSELAAKS